MKSTNPGEHNYFVELESSVDIDYLKLLGNWIVLNQLQTWTMMLIFLYVCGELLNTFCLALIIYDPSKHQVIYLYIALVSRLGLVVRRSAGKRKDVRFDSQLRLTFLLKHCDLWTLSRDLALHN